MLRIYGNSSSGNCLKVRYAAAFGGWAYEWVEVNSVAGETRTDEFLSLNPAGQVPVVDFGDGRRLSQSNAIIKFLLQDPALIGADPWESALIDQWLFWEQYSHEPFIGICRADIVYFGKRRDEREPWRVAKGEEALNLMEAALSGRKYLTLDRFTVADLALLFYTRWAEDGGFDLSPRPSVAAWIARCEARLGLEATVRREPAA